MFNDKSLQIDSLINHISTYLMISASHPNKSNFSSYTNPPVP